MDNESSNLVSSQLVPVASRSVDDDYRHRRYLLVDSGNRNVH
jgi:hypothetical protein